MAKPPPPQTPRVVLDTNAALDWLVFDDPRIRPLAAAIVAGTVRWLVSPLLRDEFRAVLLRPEIRHRVPATGAAASEPAHAALDRLSSLHPDPPPGSFTLRCRDPDDQMFIDLAVAGRARWLVTRDKALLALRARAQVFGLAILMPEAWCGELSSGARSPGTTKPAK